MKGERKVAVQTGSTVALEGGEIWRGEAECRDCLRAASNPWTTITIHRRRGAAQEVVA